MLIYKYKRGTKQSQLKKTLKQRKGQINGKDETEESNGNYYRSIRKQGNSLR